MLARKVISTKILSGVLALTALAAFPASSGPERAPRFRAKTLDGETFTNDSVKGKVVLLQFWTTWCKYCRREQPLVDDIHREFAAKGLVLLAVNVGESKKKVKKYLEENPRSVRIVLTEDTNLAAMYAATAFPLYVAIDREGNIAGIQPGAGGERGLRNLLSRAGLESEEKP
ncbi:MAG: TlpA family protein disulfide reductase [Acidobacteria bacterium]|nr:TlpA family protein disulfide reductase [Acidobacteriota bacterium]